MTKEHVALKRGELIGKNVEVSNGLKGRIIYETKEMFFIKTEKGIKKIKKADHKFEFIINKKSIIVDGKEIAKRPEDRIKIKK